MTSPNNSRLVRALAVTAAALVAVTGCARKDAPPSGATQSTGTGKITVACGATEDWCKAMTDAFTKNTGIEARFVRLSSGETVAKLQASKDKPEFHAWLGGPSDGHAAAFDKDLVEAYTSPAASAIPARYKDPSGAWTGIYVGALGFCSNKKVLDEKKLAVPASWQDLLDPALRKGIGISHPGSSGTGYTALWTHVTLGGGNQDAALEYYKKLNPNVLNWSKSGLAPATQAANGEVATGVLFSHDCVAAQDLGNKDLVLTFPAEGTGYEVGAVSVVKGSDNVVDARKLVDWALSAQAQEIGPTVQSYQRPTNPGAKVSEKSFDDTKVKLVEYDAIAAGKAKSELTRKFASAVTEAPK